MSAGKNSNEQISSQATASATEDQIYAFKCIGCQISGPVHMGVVLGMAKLNQPKPYLMTQRYLEWFDI